MSNVIRASAFYSDTTKQAIVGKIYEDLHTDESGNTSLRYVRLIKATATVTTGDICHVAAANANALYSTGEAAPLGAAENEAIKVAGVAIADIASGSFGFVVCRGVVDKVNVAGGYGGAVGALLATGGGAGEVAALTLGAGKSAVLCGIALSTKASDNTIKAYLNLI
jgi:hypothetical protein